MANPFDFAGHLQRGPAQTTGSGGGGGKNKRKNKKPNRPNNPGGGGGGGTKPPPPITDDGWETDFWLDQPQAAYAAFAGEQGFDMGGTDAFGNWMNAQYEPLRADWLSTTADAANRELTFQDYLSGLGGADGVRQGGPQPLQPLAGPGGPPNPGLKSGLRLVGRGQPPPAVAPRIPGPSRPAESGPGSGFYDEMMRRYQLSSLESKGLQYSPFEGFSRWLAF